MSNNFTDLTHNPLRKQLLRALYLYELITDITILCATQFLGKSACEVFRL